MILSGFSGACVDCLRVGDGGRGEGLQSTTGRGEGPSCAMCQLILVFRFRILNFLKKKYIFFNVSEGISACKIETGQENEDWLRSSYATGYDGLKARKGLTTSGGTEGTRIVNTAIFRGFNVLEEDTVSFVKPFRVF